MRAHFRSGLIGTGGVHTKKYIASIIGCCLVVALGVLTVTAFAAHRRKGPIVLTYAELNALEGTIVGEMAKAFKAKTEELSDGSIRIDIKSGGVLGSEDQILDNLLGGGNITDLARISAQALTQYGCEKASLLSIPYTFVNEDHFWRFAESDLAQDFLLEPQEIGLPLRGLCYGEEGFRHFFFTREVSGIESLKNRKIRVSSDPVMTGMLDDLGAFATNVAFTELYSALSTGVVDGAEQPVTNYLSNAFPEVAPCLIRDGHTLGALQIVIAEYSWEKLNEQQREWLMEAAQYASMKEREAVSRIEKETYKELSEKGVTVVEASDKAAWAKACQSTIKAYSSKHPDLYQQILDLYYNKR